MGVRTGDFDLRWVYRSHLLILDEMEYEELAHQDDTQARTSSSRCTYTRECPQSNSQRHDNFTGHSRRMVARPYLRQTGPLLRCLLAQCKRTEGG